jgi:hypothetical protein
LRTTVVDDGPNAARVELTIADASTLEAATESVVLSVRVLVSSEPALREIAGALTAQIGLASVDLDAPGERHPLPDKPAIPDFLLNPSPSETQLGRRP